MRGDGWLNGSGCCFTTQHRIVRLAVDGTRFIKPETFAIDWVRLQDGRLFEGDGSRVDQYYAFGAELLAVADGTESGDRRLTRDEEKRLLDSALQKMNTPEHQLVGPLLHDRIIGALELVCRRGEMLLIQNRRVNWETCQIGIPGATAKDTPSRAARPPKDRRSPSTSINPWCIAPACPICPSRAMATDSGGYGKA